MRTSLVAFGAVALAVVTIAASSCGGDDSTNATTNPDSSTTDSTTNTDTSTTTDTGGGSDTTTTTDTNVGDVRGDGSVQGCVAQGNQCQQCCTQNNQAGSDAYDRALTACLCVNSVCGDKCSQTVCATPQSGPPPQPCKDCIGTATGAAGACSPTVVTAACVTDAGASCTTYRACVAACP
jgi:hypothetical protein